MKITRILAAGAFALALTTVAQATDTTVIHIAGSSAFRKATVDAAIVMLGGTSNVSIATCDTKAVNATNAANVTGSLAYAVGTLAKGSPVTICFSWTGSAGGLNCLANDKVSTVRGFIDSSITSGSNQAIGDTTSIVEIATSDVYKESSGFDGMDNLTESPNSPVGICPFKWVVTGTASGITNITPQAAHALFSAGKLSKAVFTGVLSDSSTTVYATGRDADSGTRLTALAETGIGANATVMQYVLADGTDTYDEDGNLIASAHIVNQDTGFSTDASTYRLIPARPMTINGLDYNQGDTGYASGGNLANTLRLIPGLSGDRAATAITYLSTGDAGTAIAGSTGINATELTYNGVSYSPANVYNGSYTFWSYEHLFYKTGSDKADFGDALALEIQKLAARSGLPLSDMTVSRSADGGVIGTNY